MGGDSGLGFCVCLVNISFSCHIYLMIICFCCEFMINLNTCSSSGVQDKFESPEQGCLADATKVLIGAIVLFRIAWESPFKESNLKFVVLAIFDPFQEQVCSGLQTIQLAIQGSRGLTIHQVSYYGWKELDYGSCCNLLHYKRWRMPHSRNRVVILSHRDLWLWLYLGGYYHIFEGRAQPQHHWR